MIEGNDAGMIRILVIEDNPGDVELIRMALELAGVDCDLQVIDEGEGAMAYVQQPRNSSGERLPDLVLLDLNLPKHSGLEILEAIRGNPCFPRVLEDGEDPRWGSFLALSAPTHEARALSDAARTNLTAQRAN